MGRQHHKATSSRHDALAHDNVATDRFPRPQYRHNLDIHHRLTVSSMPDSAVQRHTATHKPPQPQITTSIQHSNRAHDTLSKPSAPTDPNADHPACSMWWCLRKPAHAKRSCDDFPHADTTTTASNQPTVRIEIRFHTDMKLKTDCPAPDLSLFFIHTRGSVPERGWLPSSCFRSSLFSWLRRLRA